MRTGGRKADDGRADTNPLSPAHKAFVGITPNDLYMWDEAALWGTGPPQAPQPDMEEAGLDVPPQPCHPLHEQRG